MRLAAVLAALVSGLAASAEARELREVKDATGAVVRLAERPMRVVALAPSLGELAAEFCGERLDRIVGVSEYTDYPAALLKTASVGPYSRFNLEKVVALKPDLVLATTDGNAKDQVLHLRELGLPVVVVDTSSLAQVEASLRLVGRAMGAAAEGERQAARFKEGLAAFRARAAKRAGPVPRVLVQVGDGPLVVAGRQSFLHEALETVGAANVYGDTPARYPRPSAEDVVRRDPDAILVLALGPDAAPYEKMAREWRRFASLRAVRSGRARVLKGDTVVRPTLRLLEGLSLLEKAVHDKG